MAHLLRQRVQRRKTQRISRCHRSRANKGQSPPSWRVERYIMSALYSSSAARRALLEERARVMRHHSTLSEQLLWSAIRGKRLGVAFRRQQVIGQFIVDFLAREIALVVEIDGDAYHATRVKADAARQRKLVRAGYTVLRLPASLVERDLGRAVAIVRDMVEREMAEK
jgi:very-short-patch-repair endonuclease